MRRISRKNFALIFMIIAVAFLVFPRAANDGVASTKFWPIESKRVAEDIFERYGKPDLASSDMLIWNKRGPWDRITISRTGVLHKFPFEHFDVLEQTLPYKVPPEKLYDLIMFDGSLLIDRTRGTVSARCDHESSNVLVLNLAHEVATGKKSVADARLAYGKIIQDKLNGADPAIMKELSFAVDRHAPDPDVNITGLASPRSAHAQKRWFSRSIAGMQ